MAALHKSKVAATAGVLLVLFASSMMAAADAEEERGNDYCDLCRATKCGLAMCSAICPKCAPRKERASDEQQLREPKMEAAAAAAAAEEERGNEGRLQQKAICMMCLDNNCDYSFCTKMCPHCGIRKKRAGDEQKQLRQPDYYCVLCYQKRCPASCRSGCPRYCGRASSE